MSQDPQQDWPDDGGEEGGSGALLWLVLGVGLFCGVVIAFVACQRGL